MINLLFDATFLGQEYLLSKPTGIYICAYHILKEFLNSPDLRLSFYCEPEYYWPLKKLLKTDFPEYQKSTIVSITDFFSISRFLFLLITILTIKRGHIKFIPLRKTISLIIKIAVFILRSTSFLNFDFTKKLKPFDVYFSPCLAPPKNIRKNRNIICFILLHDITALIFNKTQSKWWFNLAKNITSNDYYFNDSACTRQDFIDNFPLLDPKKSFVTHLAAAENFKVISDKTNISIVKKKYSIESNKKYIFALCTLEERKNLVLACTAFIEFVKRNKLTDMIFLLGGTYREQFFEKIGKLIPVDSLKYIQYIGYVDDDDLPTLYNNSLWFVYTSSYEGFGMPPLEAMQCGCPVIVSNSSSLPEVVGNAGIQIDYDSMEQHIKAYETYYFNENIRKEYIKLGLEQAKKFSWKKTNRIMIESFYSALSKKSINTLP